ncbi:ABC transporter ATP-binding protein [Alkaliphilus hydrothermalis]|uniref:ABC-2 type transport system ATP-binding protein n=1 Tax=Alkaliphilus hydrothermalis TaxID=1482730 RepID=A0ABS2NMW8_9FIRM|nr:ABC transporter ATP-binding protein [Alkaliphilus hydrothermalis]MBM7614287.1 ABC-2 type transport system ATP-binding protein [Alkaliphilus hydrothermalis]
MIKVEGLVKSYGKHEVLKGLNFEVKNNEIYGFLGHNGAGKSTTINILTNLIKPTKGNVSVNGSIGYLPEDPKFYTYMTGAEYLKLIGEISGFSKSNIATRSAELLELVGLKKDAKRKVGGYSRGMRQRLGFAVALFNKPQILLLDEPASALDPEGRKEMLDLIQQFKNEGGTVFLSSHILSDLERIADRIGILNKGSMVLEGSLEEIKGEYLLPIYDIEFENPIGALPKRLLAEAWVEDIQVKGTVMSVGISNPIVAKTELLRILAENNQPVTSYQVRKSSLEDIYMRAVKENA